MLFHAHGDYGDGVVAAAAAVGDDYYDHAERYGDDGAGCGGCGYYAVVLQHSDHIRKWVCADVTLAVDCDQHRHRHPYNNMPMLSRATLCHCPLSNNLSFRGTKTERISLDSVPSSRVADLVVRSKILRSVLDRHLVRLFGFLFKRLRVIHRNGTLE